MQDRSFRNHFLDMILGLREYEKDVRNATLNDLCQFPIFVESTA